MPFLHRMRAVLALADPGARVPIADARRTLRRTAPMTHLQHGPPELLEADLLRAAVRRELLRCDETEHGQPDLWSESATLQRGEYAHLVAGHPLAAVVEPWIDEMMRDPIAAPDCDPRLSGPWWSVPFLIVQLLAHVGEVDLADVAEVIRREAGPLTRGIRLPWKLQNAVVGLVVGVCVEFGIAEWDGGMHDLGRARITPLGAWAQLALRAHVEGEVPPGFMHACGAGFHPDERR
ncbi:hypothetical protein BH23ACT10_BH23ACT10_19620 [soil metagenome]